MKKNMMMLLALVAMTAGVSVNAETATQNVSEITTSKLSADEQAFVAKLSDFNRKSFCEKLSTEQRKSAMTAVKNGANADEAVQNLVTLKDMKDSAALANAESAVAEKSNADATATK